MTRTWNDCEPKQDRKGNIEKKVCRHIWEKMWRSWVHVQENHIDQAGWFCKVDYDTFFFPDNLKYFVRDEKNWDPYNEYHYFGHWMSHRRAGREPMIVGRCLRAILEASVASVKIEHMILKKSQPLKQHLSVDAEPARDKQHREYVIPSKLLTWNRTEQGEWWYWPGKPDDVGQEEECCAHRPIGLHKYKLPEQIMQVHQQFLGEKDNDDCKRLTAKSKIWVDKVRKALGVDP
ncbi:hypothetical protein ACHAXN_010888 [Cyclotella atomus]